MLNEQGEIYSKNEFIKTGFPQAKQIASAWYVARRKSTARIKNDNKRNEYICGSTVLNSLHTSLSL